VVADMTVALQRLVGTAYDRAALALARSADPIVYRSLAGPLVDAVVDALGSPAGPVLDVAAGTGAFGSVFERVVAVDISAGQLLANPTPHRARAEAARLPFRDDAFAAVGCAFGINHLADPAPAVRDMARVAPVVAVSTWARPEVPYAPKRIVQAALERQAGSSRSPLGVALDDLSGRVGSVQAVTELLVAAGVEPSVREVVVEIPWLGSEAFVDYRLAMPSSPHVTDLAGLRADVAGAIAELSPDELLWRPRIVIGVGRRHRCSQ
jgi:SAM-dependent methyltransferase